MKKTNKPVVGEWATRILDGNPFIYKVYDVSEDGKTVVLEYYEALYASEGLSLGHQEWKFEPTGFLRTIVKEGRTWKTENNRGYLKGIKISFGVLDYKHVWLI